MENTSLQTELIKWANETVKVYLDYANEHEDAPAFYTQSPLNGITKSPELLIMGINPGSIGTYNGQKNQATWGLNGKDITGEDLLRGNFCVYDGKTGWEHFWEYTYGQRLMEFLSETNIDPFSYPNKYVLTNATFFATLQAKDINGVLPKTCMQTLKLLETLSPKKVIILSGYRTTRIMRGLINKCEGKDKYQISIRDFKAWDGCVYKCSKGELLLSSKKIPYIGIPHPSYRNIVNNREGAKFASIIAQFMKE